MSLACKVYVGDLPRDANEKDLERAFQYYGSLRNVWVARNPPGFAFVEFEDERDAEDAVRGLDGTNIAGGRVRVEHSSGKVRPKPWLRDTRDSRDSRDSGPRGRRPFDSQDRCYECGESGHYAYDCSNKRGGGGGGRSRSRRSRSRSYEKRSYRSRSRSRGRRSYTRSPTPLRQSRGERRRSYSRSLSRDRSPVRRDKSVERD